MKLNKLALFLLAAVAFTACEDEADYTEAAVESGAQVYFSSSNAAVIPLTRNAESFDIAISRVVTDQEITVPITVTTTDKVSAYSFPSSVTFAAGESVATYTVRYDESKLDWNYADTTTLSIDPSVTTTYGIANYTFTSSIALTWTSLGIGFFNDDYYFGTGDFKVEIFQQDQDPNVYRMKNPYVTYLLSENYTPSEGASEYFQFEILKKGDVIFGETIPEDGYVYYDDGGVEGYINTGYTNSNYDADVLVLFPALLSSTASVDSWANNIVKVYCEDGTPGVIKINPRYYMLGVGGWNATVETDAITITMPAYDPKDYDVDVTINDVNLSYTTGQTSTKVTVNLGADVDSVVLANVPMSSLLYLDSFEKAYLNGQLATVVATASGSYDVPTYYTGYDVAIYAIVYGDESVQDEILVPFNNPGTKGLNDGFTEFGTATWTDDILTIFSDVESSSYTVQVLTDNEGTIRVINPYGEANPYYRYATDAMDAKMDIILMSETSALMDVNNLGIEFVYSGFIYTADMYLLGYEAAPAGTVTDDKITFAKNGLVTIMGEDLYYGNQNGLCALDFSTSGAKAAADNGNFVRAAAAKFMPTKPFSRVKIASKPVKDEFVR